jgi:hypothetical protein
MPRYPRVHASGLLYHVMARGNNGQDIFSEAKDYEVFLEQLREARRRYPFYLYAYVLMPNHFHLLLEVMELPTARIMQSLLTAMCNGWLLVSGIRIDLLAPSLVVCGDAAKAKGRILRSVLSRYYTGKSTPESISR